MTKTVRDEHLCRYEYESGSAAVYPGAALGPYRLGVRSRR
jgi:hypothetical protein